MKAFNVGDVVLFYPIKDSPYWWDNQPLPGIVLGRNVDMLPQKENCAPVPGYRLVVFACDRRKGGHTETLWLNAANPSLAPMDGYFCDRGA